MSSLVSFTSIRHREEATSQKRMQEAVFRSTVTNDGGFGVEGSIEEGLVDVTNSLYMQMGFY